MKTNKRIGTLTLGISLCYIGLTLILSLFCNLDIILLMMRLFPSMLVLLGGEVILYSLQKNKERPSYDGISIFLIILFCFGSLTVAGIGWGIQTYQLNADQNQWYYFFNQAFRWYPLAF